MSALENGPGSALPAPEDLHDHVIQELFTLGLRIQGDAARSEPVVVERINGYAETLDEVITTIRTSMVGLHRQFDLFRQAGDSMMNNRVQPQKWCTTRTRWRTLSLGQD
jgi:hypothetical protein